MTADTKSLIIYILKIVILEQQNQKIIIKITDQALELIIRILIKIIKTVNKTIKNGSDRAITVKKISNKNIVFIFSNNTNTIIKKKLNRSYIKYYIICLKKTCLI